MYLFKNNDYLKLSISTTLILGFFNVYIVIINRYFSYYGLTTKEISIISSTSYAAGVVGAIFLSLIADRTKRYKSELVTLNSILFLNQLVMTVMMEFYKGHVVYFVLTLVCYAITGFTILSIITISIDYVCEITYPIGESISVGLIISNSRILGFIAVYKFMKKGLLI